MIELNNFRRELTGVLTITKPLTSGDGLLSDILIGHTKVLKGLGLHTSQMNFDINRNMGTTCSL